MTKYKYEIYEVDKETYDGVELEQPYGNLETGYGVLIEGTYSVDPNGDDCFILIVRKEVVENERRGAETEQNIL